MAPADYSLLVVPAVVLLLAVLSVVSARVDAAVTRVSTAAFSRFETATNRRVNRQQSLRAAHVATTYDVYAARTATKATLGGVAGGVAGIYALWGALEVLSIPQSTAEGYLPDRLSFLAEFVGIVPPSGVELFAYQAGAALVFGVGTALAVYYYRWYYPRYVADERERRIDMSLPMTVSFFYALSRSGMSFPNVMRVLAENDHVYGTAADEVEMAVRNVELFGMDVVTAVKTMARRSPSEKFREFSENLASVLQTGGSLSEFLNREYQEFRQEAKAQQERLLELVATLAEAYVTLGVVGPLFLIVVLTVAGIAVSDSLPFMRVVVYAVMPLGNLAFMIYLSTVVESLSGNRAVRSEKEVSVQPRGVRRTADLAAERTTEGDRGRLARLTDGGAEAGRRVRENLDRLTVYKQWREVGRRLASPIRTVVHRPTALLWITFPLAVFLIGIRIPGRLADGILTVAEFDDLVIQSLILLLGTFAIAYGVHRRRVEAIESSIPDFLERMASLNEAGMTVVDSFDRIRDSELGTLNEEIEVVWRDMQWGADVETALKRFESRVRTQTVSRTVTLMTEAMKASGNLGRVLRIAADQAKSDRRLKAKRRQEMLTYVVVVYIAFFVFLFIVGVVNVLLGNLPEAGATSGFLNNSTGVTGTGTASVPGVSQLGQIDQAAYRLTFLHATVVQAVFSGLVAGQLSTGDVRSGAKHATILLILGYAAFVLFLGG